MPHYRSYTPQDFPSLYAIEELCFDPPERFPRAYMRQILRQPNAATWIAEHNSKMLGFAIAEWAGKPEELYAYIQTLEVLPEARGQGIGRQLLSLLEASAREAKAQAIWLHVDAENAPAIRVYESRNYQPAGREKDYYGLGRPALVYAKLLQASRF